MKISSPVLTEETPEERQRARAIRNGDHATVAKLRHKRRVRNRNARRAERRHLAKRLR